MKRKRSKTARRKCTAKTKQGKPCRMRPLAGSKRCWTHAVDPKVVARRAVGVSRGGQARKHQPKASKPADVSTLQSLQRILAQVLADTMLLPNTPRRSAAAARLLSVGSALIEAAETRLMLDKLMTELNA